MSDHWDFYITDDEGEHPRSTFVDLGIHKSAPDNSRPWLAIVSINMVAPREDGLSSCEEYETLIRVEDLIVDSLEKENAQYVGRVTTEGRRVLHFYSTKQFDSAPHVIKALTEHPDYTFSVESPYDPEWKNYLERLYPNPEQWETIKNLHVLDELEKNGDALKAARPLDHWAYFPNEVARNAFKAEAEKLRYSAHILPLAEKKHGPNRFGIQLTRTDHVDSNSINDITLPLFRLAQEFKGEYDGWETQVVK